jgi:predicted nucleic acid-binding protein
MTPSATKVVLLDTDVASFLIKKDSRAANFFPHLKGQQPALSFMSVAELFQWAEMRHWGERRKAGLEMLLNRRYVILGFELGLAKEWARVRAEAKEQGRPISVQDGWIAATGRYFSLPVLTNNRKDFERVAGLVLLPSED